MSRSIPLAAVLAATVLMAGPADGASVVTAGRWSGGSAELEIALQAEPGSPTVRVVVESRVRAGSVDWRLLDPAGNTVFEGSCDGGKLKLDSGEVAPAAGVWRLQLRTAEARGRYEVRSEGLRATAG